MVQSGTADRAILVCGTGLGMSMAANRFSGVRAAVVWNAEVAQLSREHNDANVLCLPGRFMTLEVARDIATTWLETPFGGGRHQRRIDKIERIAGSGRA
jgi:ribose 5-phosphate isomerase B